MSEPSACDRLQQLVANGDIEITYIDHLPRTISHALKRCLFELFDLQFNEPFFDPQQDGTQEHPAMFDTGCEYIVRRYKEFNTQHPHAKPVKILVKDTAKGLPGASWERWCGLTRNVVTLIRDPHMQLFSLMEVMANDHLNAGENKADRETILHTRGKVIAKALRLTGTADFNSTSWKPIARHVEALEQMPQVNHVLLDGNMLLLEPEKTMRELSQRLGLEYKPCILNDWGKSANGFPNEREWGKSQQPIGNAWTSHAFSKDGFRLPEGHCIPAGDYPEQVRAHLLDDALPVYMHLLRDPHRIGGQSWAEVAPMLGRVIDSQGHSFAQANPTSAYAYAAALENLSQADRIARGKTLKTLRRQHPDHHASFDGMDKAIRLQEAGGMEHRIGIENNGRRP